MDCTLILTAVYAAAAVVSMTVTACSAVETKKILAQIKAELLKNKDSGNDTLISWHGTAQGQNTRGGDADAQDAGKSSIKKYAVKIYAASQGQAYQQRRVSGCKMGFT